MLRSLFLFVVLAPFCLFATGSTVPVVDLDLFFSDEVDKQEQFIHELGQSLLEYGCVAIENSGISADLKERALDEAKNYFSLPFEEKLKGISPRWAHGYTPMRGGVSKEYDQGDVKEFYHLTGSSHPEALWPKSCPEFQYVMTEFHERFEELSRHLLQAIALFLGHEETLLSDLIQEGSSTLRVLHYPPVKTHSQPGEVRCHEHFDLNVLTLIPKPTHKGLQILTPRGDWIDVDVPDGAVILSPSTFLGYVTNNQIPATLHRVANSETEDHRYSFPFFAAPYPDAILPILHVDGVEFSELSYGEILDDFINHS